MKATLQDEMTFKFYSVSGQAKITALFLLLRSILLQQGIWKFKVELDLLLCILLLWSLFFLATTLNSDKFLLFSYSNEYTKQSSSNPSIYLASHLDFFII